MDDSCLTVRMRPNVNVSVLFQWCHSRRLITLAFHNVSTSRKKYAQHLCKTTQGHMHESTFTILYRICQQCFHNALLISALFLRGNNRYYKASSFSSPNRPFLISYLPHLQTQCLCTTFYGVPGTQNDIGSRLKRLRDVRHTTVVVRVCYTVIRENKALSL